MIFRNCRSASSMPAAVQRRVISPELQRFTLRWVRRTISIIDSHVGRLERALEVAADGEPRQRQRLLESFPERAGGAGIRSSELRGERSQLIERTHGRRTPTLA